MTTVMFGSTNTLSLLFVIVLWATIPCIFADESTSQANENKTTLLSNLYKAKSLKKDINEHINYLEDILKHLDIWAFEEVEKLTENEQLEIVLEKLEDNMKVIQFNISSLLSSELPEDVKEIKAKSERLQNELSSLLRGLDNKTYEGLKLIGEYLDKPNIGGIYKNLSEEKIFIDKKIAEQEQTILAQKCVEYILTIKYVSAVFTLETIRDDNVIYIIERIYSKSKNNFTLLLNFADNIRNISKALTIYEELYNRIKNESSINELTELTKSIKKEIIDELNVTPELKFKAVILVTTIKDKIKKLTLKELAEILTIFKYVQNLDANKLTFLEEIFEVDDRLLVGIFEELVSNQTIANKNMDNEKFLQQFVNQLITKYEQNTGKWLKLCYFVKNLKNKLLVDTEDLVYSHSFLQFWNKFGRYIYDDQLTVYIKRPSDMGILSYDSVTKHNNKTYIKVHSKLNSGNYGKWRIIREEDGYYNMIPIDKPDKYLGTHYGDQIFKSNNHPVFIDDIMNKPHNGLWDIWLTDYDHDYNYNNHRYYFNIKNIVNNEYLYSSFLTDNFAFTKKYDNDKEQFKWDCS